MVKFCAPPGQVRDAAVAGEHVGEGDDRPGVQVSVRREKGLAEPELASHQPLGNFGENEPDQAGQVVLAKMIEAFDVESGPQRHGFPFARCRYHPAAAGDPASLPLETEPLTL